MYVGHVANEHTGSVVPSSRTPLISGMQTIVYRNTTQDAVMVRISSLKVTLLMSNWSMNEERPTWMDAPCSNRPVRSHAPTKIASGSSRTWRQDNSQKRRTQRHTFARSARGKALLSACWALHSQMCSLLAKLLPGNLWQHACTRSNAKHRNKSLPEVKKRKVIDYLGFVGIKQ